MKNKHNKQLVGEMKIAAAEFEKIKHPTAEQKEQFQKKIEKILILRRLRLN